jgi:hypothetical protein
VFLLVTGLVLLKLGVSLLELKLLGLKLLPFLEVFSLLPFPGVVMSLLSFLTLLTLLGAVMLLPAFLVFLTLLGAVMPFLAFLAFLAFLPFLTVFSLLEIFGLAILILLSQSPVYLTFSITQEITSHQQPILKLRSYFLNPNKIYNKYIFLNI